MVRAVSDLADENKGLRAVEKWRSYACAAAASFIIALLRDGPVPLSQIPSQKGIDTVPAKPMPLVDRPVSIKQIELGFEENLSKATPNRSQDIDTTLTKYSSTLFVDREAEIDRVLKKLKL